MDWKNDCLFIGPQCVFPMRTTLHHVRLIFWNLPCSSRYMTWLHFSLCWGSAEKRNKSLDISFMYEVVVQFVFDFYHF